MKEQLERVEQMKHAEGWTDYSKKKIVIGIVGGDGIGPYICKHARTVLEFLLAEEIIVGQGGAAHHRGADHREPRQGSSRPYPTDVLAELKRCHVILKGPTTTPKKGDPWPNIESANVAMRRELDLFANVRPVRVPEQGIDWMFFRENTEGSYILGSKGVNVTDDLAFDFCVATTQGSERIIRLAFEHAKKNGIDKVTVVTKANVVKTTDGKFLSMAERVAKDYPGIKWDDWFIDIMTAKLIDEARRHEFKVMVLPNLYGDIITDEAAQIQGGVGTAGSANIGTQVRHVRGHPRFRAAHGRGRSRAVRRPIQHHQGRGHAPEPHRLHREIHPPGDGARHLLPV